MSWKIVNDRKKMQKLIDHLISKKMELKVVIDAGGEAFSTRLIKARDPASSAEMGQGDGLIVERWFPETGNNPLQPLQDICTPC